MRLFTQKIRRRNRRPPKSSKLTPRQSGPTSEKSRDAIGGRGQITVVVVQLLTCTIVSFTLPSLLRDDQPFSTVNLNLAIRTLVGLVLLFNIYSLWQQLRIKGLCDEIQQKQAKFFTLWPWFDPLTAPYNRRFKKPRLEAEVVRRQKERLITHAAAFGSRSV